MGLTNGPKYSKLGAPSAPFHLLCVQSHSSAALIHFHASMHLVSFMQARLGNARCGLGFSTRTLHS